jgi:Lon protease-like protein
MSSALLRDLAAERAARRAAEATAGGAVGVEGGGGATPPVEDERGAAANNDDDLPPPPPPADAPEERQPALQPSQPPSPPSPPPPPAPLPAAPAPAPASAAARAAPPADADRDDFDCPLCYKLLVEPLGLLCGHTFCKACVKRSLALQPACPMCRAPCFIAVGDVVPNLLLARVIAARFPDELAARLPEVAADEAELDAQRLGLFLLKGTGTLFPTAPLSLLVYEPRYLLLMQRCMNNNVPFGVQEDARAPCGVAVKIEGVQQMPGGRLLVTGAATARYKPASPPAVEDGTFGLHYAPVQFLADEPLSSQPGPLGAPLEGPLLLGLSARSRALLAGCAHDAHAATLLRNALATVTVRLVSSLSPGAFRSLAARHGAPPPPTGPGSGPERWSYYASGLLALPPEARGRAFDTSNTLERLLLCYAFLEGCEAEARGAPAPAAAPAAAAADGGGGAGAVPDGDGLPPGELDPCRTVLPAQVLDVFARGGGVGGAGGLLGRGLCELLSTPLASSLGVLVLLLAGIYFANREHGIHHHQQQHYG